MARSFTSIDIILLNSTLETLKKNGFTLIECSERTSDLDAFANYYECYCTHINGNEYNVNVDPFSEKILSVRNS